MTSWQIVLLEDSLVPKHFEVLLVLRYHRFLYTCHTRLLLEQMHHLFLRVCAWSNFRFCSINDPFVNGTHIKALIFAKSAFLRFRFIKVVVETHRPTLICILGKKIVRRLLLGVPELQISGSHGHFISLEIYF